MYSYSKSGFRQMRPLEGTASEKIYRIGAIGRHLRYGEKEDDGQDPRPMVAWHDVTHDHASYRDLVQLADLLPVLRTFLGRYSAAI
jgi:hypothetical protein